MVKEAPPITREVTLLPRWLREAFRWRTVRNTGAWLYQENTATGRRRAIRGSGYQPLDRQWLDGGPWSSREAQFISTMVMGPAARPERFRG